VTCVDADPSPILRSEVSIFGGNFPGPAPSSFPGVSLVLAGGVNETGAKIGFTTVVDEAGATAVDPPQP